MSGAQTKFTLVDETPAAAPPGNAAAQAGMRMILAGLHTLSARALTAISDLFSLILVGLTGFLAWHVLDNPSPQQMMTVFGFAFFCLLIDGVRRRSK